MVRCAVSALVPRFGLCGLMCVRDRCLPLSVFDVSRGVPQGWRARPDHAGQQAGGRAPSDGAAVGTRRGAGRTGGAGSPSHGLPPLPELPPGIQLESDADAAPPRRVRHWLPYPVPVLPSQGEALRPPSRPHQEDTQGDESTLTTLPSSLFLNLTTTTPTFHSGFCYYFAIHKLSYFY